MKCELCEKRIKPWFDLCTGCHGMRAGRANFFNAITRS